MRCLLPCQSQAKDCEDRHTLPDTLRMLAPVGPGQFSRRVTGAGCRKPNIPKGKIRKPGSQGGAQKK